MWIKNLIKRTILYRSYIERKKEKKEERKRRKNEAFLREGLDVLRVFSESLNKEGIPFWLNFGTLLGYYREHDLIKHDYDLDTGAWYKDHELVKAALEKNGFERIRLYYLKNKEGLEECYKHKDFDTTIDVFYFINEGEISYCYSFYPCVPMNKRRNLNKIQPSRVRKWTYDVFTVVPAEFKRITVNIPQDTVRFLKSLYGETFMTPIPDFPVQGRPNMTLFTYEEEPACAFLKIGYN